MLKYLKYIWQICLCLWPFVLQAQTPPFNVHLEPFTINGLGGLQSYSFGQHNGKWLIVGGRLDGLHRRQPWASFDEAGHNNQLIVISPTTQQVWSAKLSSLPIQVQEQLSATNMEFYQEGDYLYCMGGYGYSPTLEDHTTYDNLTALHIPNLIEAIIHQTDINPHIQQISHPWCQVTGGKLKKLNKQYYLLGGQKFIGVYNPMGPDHGPGFTQEYTNAIRIFNIKNDGKHLSLQPIQSYKDSVQLHRRDFNAESQILPNGQQAITMFSGVFQYTADLPFLNAIQVDAEGFTPIPSFQQFYNHYHCPVIPLYNKVDKKMHTLFFGGIAQFYPDQNGKLIQDDDVPFVKTIARVTCHADGSMQEYKLPIEMPDYLGAGAEFIPQPNLPTYSNGVIKLHQLTADTLMIGYIYGGINSTAKNIFWSNSDEAESSASAQIFKVYLLRNASQPAHQANIQSNNPLMMAVYPNIDKGSFTVSFNVPQASDFTFSIANENGKILLQETLPNLKAGSQEITYATTDTGLIGTFLLTLSNPQQTVTRTIELF